MLNIDRHLINAVFTGGFVLFFCQAILTHLHRKVKNRNVSTSVGSGDEMILHQGSCFCRRVRFRVKAPKILQEMNTPSKTNFPRLNVPWYLFELLSGESAVSLYTNQGKTESYSYPWSGGKHNADVEIEVLAFCSFCGVHVLYSPSLEPEKVQVNVDCIHCGDTVGTTCDISTITSMNQHNKRGEGALSPTPGALIAFRSMLFENQTNAFEYAGLPNSTDAGPQPSNRLNKYSGLATTEVSRDHSNSDILWGGRDMSISLNMSSSLQNKIKGDLLKELAWTEMLSCFDSDSNIIKATLPSPKSAVMRAGSRHDLFDSPDIEECSVHSFSSCISKVRGHSTDSSMFTDAQSDVDTNSLDDDNDCDDSLSVLSSLLTGEDPASPSPSTGPCRWGGQVQVQGHELGVSQNRTVNPMKLHHRRNIHVHQCSDVTTSEETYTEDSPTSLTQMRRHLSQYLQKSLADKHPRVIEERKV